MKFKLDENFGSRTQTKERRPLMYLAPLNYDRYFKKVFSDERIAKRFLEDFLGVTIASLEELAPAASGH